VSQTLSVSDAQMGEKVLSVTSRDNGDEPKILEELTYRTIKAWLFIVSFLEQGVYNLPPNSGSVESRYADEINKSAVDKKPFAFVETFGDSRVTVWDTWKSSKHIGFHLNSDDNLQTAVNTWLANQNAVKRAYEEFASIQQKVSETAVKPSNSSATPMATPKSQNAPQNGTSAVLYTKKDALAKLQPGDAFKMKIVQIEKHSKDGLDFYEFFEPYGGKAGQFSAASVFVDNEIAVGNGLIAYMDSLGVKLGQELTGNWVLNCTIGKPKTKVIKGEEKPFTNIYVNSFEGQPQSA